MHYAHRPYPWLPAELSQQIEKHVIDRLLALWGDALTVHTAHRLNPNSPTGHSMQVIVLEPEHYKNLGDDMFVGCSRVTGGIIVRGACDNVYLWGMNDNGFDLFFDVRKVSYPGMHEVDIAKVVKMATSQPGYDEPSSAWERSYVATISAWTYKAGDTLTWRIEREVDIRKEIGFSLDCCIEALKQTDFPMFGPNTLKAAIQAKAQRDRESWDTEATMTDEDRAAAKSRLRARLDAIAYKSPHSP